MQQERIGGSLFRKMIYAAARQLDEEKEKIDSLNVFPVPDGDTGTNMALTLMAAAREVEKSTADSVGELAHAAAMGSLMGARGNSGVILSQLFRGLAQGLAKKETAGVAELAQALKEAADTAYKAVMKPVEGTMLTVARLAAEAGSRAARQGENDLVHWCHAVLESAEKALRQTPEVLPVLKEAGVVDAGGQGLITAALGALAVLQGSESTKGPVATVAVEAEPGLTAAQQVQAGTAQAAQVGIRQVEDIRYRYCTELLVRGGEVPLAALRRRLQVLGDSLLVVGDSSTAKVHVHTNTPGKVLDICGEYGEMLEIQINNMAEQNRRASRSRFEDLRAGESNGRPRQKETERTDGAETEEQEHDGLETEEQKCVSIVAVSVGDGLRAIFKSLGVDEVVDGGQTMNPSTEDLVRAIEATPVKQVILLPNNKNVIFTAQQAAIMARKTVTVIPSRSIPQGLAAAMVYDATFSLEELRERMQVAIQDVRTGEITYAVRSTTSGGLNINEKDFIGLFQGEIKVAGQDLAQVTIDLVRLMVDSVPAGIITLFYGENVEEVAARQLQDRLRQEFPEIEIELYAGGQPLYYYLISVE